jgi:hypothetical protein
MIALYKWLSHRLVSASSGFPSWPWDRLLQCCFPQFLHCCVHTLLSNGSGIVACLHNGILATGVLSEPFPSSSRLSWLQSSDCQETCHNTFFKTRNPVCSQYLSVQLSAEWPKASKFEDTNLLTGMVWLKVASHIIMHWTWRISFWTIYINAVSNTNIYNVSLREFYWPANQH